MPERDTYKAIERYAKNNNDPEAILGYRCLKRRTELAILWAAGTGTMLPLSNALDIYLGRKQQQQDSTELKDMSEGQRLQVYMAACSEAGYKIDPNAFINLK